MGTVAKRIGQRPTFEGNAGPLSGLISQAPHIGLLRHTCPLT